MGYRIEKCTACKRVYVTDTDELVGTCPHCRDSEHLALLADPKWLELDAHEQDLYKGLNKLNKYIEFLDNRIHPKKKPKTPWTPSSLICMIFIWVALIAIPVYMILSNPDGWKYVLISALSILPVIMVFGGDKLFSNHKEKKELQKLLPKQEEYFEAIAGIQNRKAAYREEWLAKQAESAEQAELANHSEPDETAATANQTEMY